MTEEPSLRLFAAFDVPADILEEVSSRTVALRRSLPDARWIPAQNQHVTLRFFGRTPQGRLEALKGLCEEVAAAHHPGEVRLSALGAFPRLRRARVLWAGIEDPTGVSAGLNAELEAGARALGFAPEERAYAPHLTLARLRVPAPVPPGAAEISFEDLPVFSVAHLVVYRSHLSNRGARYEIWKRVALG